MTSPRSVHLQALNYKRLLTSGFEREDINFETNNSNMNLPEFNEHDDSYARRLETLAAFNLRLFQESKDYFLENSFYSQYHINEDEDILLRFAELSDTEILNTELDDCSSLADKESYVGSEHNVEEEDQEDLLEDALPPPNDIKEDEEDILLRLMEVSVESDPELETEQKESHGGFKHKIVRENQEYFLQDPAYLEDDIKEDEDILRRLESDDEFKTEQKKEDEDILRRLNESVMESALQSATAAYEIRKEQKDRHVCSNCHQRLAYKESEAGFKQRMDEAIQKKLHEEASHSPDNIKEAEDPLILFMESVLEAVNAGEKEQMKDVNGDLKGGLKQKMTTEKVDLFDSGSLQVVEEIVLKFYQFIDHIIPILKDTEKVRFEVQDKFEKVNDLLVTWSKIVNKLINELERMKNDGKINGKTENIPEILVQLEINAHLVERSFHHGIGFVFNNKSSRENELSGCIKGLNRSRENLGTVLTRIRELINAKRMEEDTDSTDKFKNNTCDFNASSQLPDGFER